MGVRVNRADWSAAPSSFDLAATGLNGWFSRLDTWWDVRSVRRLFLHWACAWLVIIGPIPLAGRAAVAGAAGELTPAASAPWAMAPPVDAAMAEEVLSTEPPLYRRDATVSTGDQIASPTSAEPQQSALRSAGGFVTQAASLTGGGSRFVPLEQPLRLLDTRYWSLGPAIRLPGAQLGASELAPLVDGRRLTVRVAGANGMPSGVAGVVLNVTITAPQSAGYLTVWPAGQVPPLASNLNFGPGQTVSGLVVSPTSSDEVDVMSTASEAHVIVDLFGYFLPGEDGGLVDSDPFRIADTRETAPLGPGESRTLLYARRASTRAVLLNVTVTEPTEQTFVAATPSGRDWSGTSNLNVERGQTVANLVVAPIGPDGGVAFVNGAGSAHVVVDVMGVFDDELAGMRGAFHGLSPGRILDTRDGNPDGRVDPLGAGDVLSLTVAGRGNVPVGSTHALVTLTSTGASEPTYLTAWASGAPRPFISNLNPKPASDIPNMALVPIGADGRVNIYNAAGSVHVVVDIVGYVDPLVGVGAPVAVNASWTTGGGVDVRWLPAISPRGANPTGYIVQVSGNGPSLGGVVVAGNVRNAHVDFVAAPGEQLVAWVLPTFVVDGVARTGPRTGARFTMGNRLWAPRQLRVSQPGRVPELSWEPLGGVTGYEVAVRGTAGGWQSRWLPAESPTQTVPPQVLSPVIGLTGLDAAAVYRVAVRAVVPSGPGPWSESILVGTDQPRLREVGLSEVGPVTGNFHVAHPFTGDIRVINPISGTTLSGFTSVTMPTTVGITPDEQRLVVSSGVEQLIAILDAATGVVQRRVPLPMPGQPRVSVIDNRYAIVSVWYDNWRLDLTSGALTPVTFTRSDGGLLDTNQFPLRGSRDPNVALLGTERIRFVDGIPQGLGQAPVSSLDVRAAANGRAWLTTSCTVLDSAFQPVRTVPGCRPGAISAEGSVVYRWDSVNSHFEAIDVASGAVIARAGDSESGWRPRCPPACFWCNAVTRLSWWTFARSPRRHRQVALRPASNRWLPASVLLPTIV